MRVEILPSVASGTLQAPPSKSAAHRAMIAAALSGGCVVQGLGDSADMDATRGCLQAMGARIEQHAEGLYLGQLDPQKIQKCELNCIESGSTLRFLIPLCLMSGVPVTLKGQGRLMQRPLTEYQLMCKEYGFDFVLDGEALTVCGKLQSGEYRLSGERSSQFITGMMFALPLLDGRSTLIIEGKAQSLSYIRLTEQILRDFGITLIATEHGYIIPGNQRYQAQSVAVEGDWSNAAFPEALNKLGGRVTLTGLRADSTQGDKIYREYFEYLGTERAMDLSDCPDLAPILFALSALYGGRFVGTKRLRLKESDRIAAMQDELKKCGITLWAGEDDVVITPDGLHPPTEIIDGHNDHRIVMAMTVLLSRLGGKIDGAQAVGKSWRDFFAAMQNLGIEVREC